MIEQMTIKEAADELGVSEQFVRIGLQRGRLPWGYAVKIDKHFSYFINKKKFYEVETCQNTRGLYASQMEDASPRYTESAPC